MGWGRLQHRVWDKEPARSPALPACTVLVVLSTVAMQAAGPVVLPIEVVGADGTTATAVVDIAAGKANQAQSLRMQIHGIAYAGMVGVQVNSAPWVSLDNQSVAVAEPAKSYGGIGGGFATVSMTLALPAGAITAGENAIRFRFNHTDGLSSGFRVLAFNLVDGDGSTLLPLTAFVREDPAKWLPPRTEPQQIATGKSLWYSAPLVANNRPGAPGIRAHCSDCHAQDGRDLKYFNFSNASIIARSQFHGLSGEQGEQIASYIRSLGGPSPGLPWNPPYQPGPGIDALPVENWAAGAGLSWVLDNDEASIPYVFPGAHGGVSITAEAFRPDGNLNPREIPIALQLPDWNHWLPRVHPLDAWGTDFQQSDLWRMYDGKAIASGDVNGQFDKWSKSQKKFLARVTPHETASWSADLGNKVYSTQLWQLVKSWELAEELHLEGRSREFSGPSAEPRAWPNTSALFTAPTEAGIPDGPSGMGGSALTNEYFNNSWYEVQILLNSGNHRRHGRQPIDWLYVIERFRSLQTESHRPEPARLLIATIKALQSSDPKTGPENVLRGWRPETTVDPRIMVSADFAPTFENLTSEMRRSITEAMLNAWLDKIFKYRTAQYFAQGKTPKESYTAPKEFAGVSGGNTWLAAPQFRAAGVSQPSVERLLQWGSAYSNMAARLQY